MLEIILAIIGGLLSLSVGAYIFYKSEEIPNKNFWLSLLIVGNLITICVGLLSSIKSSSQNNAISQNQSELKEYAKTDSANNIIRDSLTNNVDSLTRKTNELTEKLYDQNEIILRLGEKTITLAEDNAKLSKERFDLITGKDSWIYLVPGTFGFSGQVPHNKFLININLVGKNPVHDVKIEINEILWANNIVGNSFSYKKEYDQEVGNLSPNSFDEYIDNKVFVLPNKNRVDYIIKISTRYEVFNQHWIFVRKQDSSYAFATQVYKWEIVDDFGGHRKKALMTYLKEDFPISKNNVKWFELPH